jgi:hypothetical protein
MAWRAPICTKYSNLLWVFSDWILFFRQKVVFWIFAMRSESDFTDNNRGTLLIELRVTPVSHRDWKGRGVRELVTCATAIVKIEKFFWPVFYLETCNLRVFKIQ